MFLVTNSLWSEQDQAIATNTPEEALDGLQPAISDWHAEANFLQVSIEYVCDPR